MIRLTLACFLAGVGLCRVLNESSERISYRGHKLYSVTTRTQLGVAFLQELENDPDLELDFWTHPMIGDVTIHVDPQVERRFLQILKEAGLEYSVIQEDLQREIDAEQLSLRNKRDEAYGSITGYLMLSEIDDLLDNLESEFPTRVKRFNLEGTTHEGRQLWGVKVTANLSDSSKKAVWVESGTHAREFITIAVSLGTIDKLARQYGAEGAEAEKATEMLDTYDWYFVPVHNPDGYNHAMTVERLWRKNRRWHNITCPNYYHQADGVDLNRNWNINFGGFGASNFKCSQAYHGIHALSEPETIALDKAVRKTNCVVAFVSLHAFSQVILLPWAYKKDKPEDYATLYRIAMSAKQELELYYNTTYKVGIAFETIHYIASGTAADYMKFVNGIKYSFTYELRPRGHDRSGFLLPEDQIRPTTTETFASLWKLIMEIHADEATQIIPPVKNLSSAFKLS